MEWPETDSKQKRQILQVQKSMVFLLVLRQVVNKVDMFGFSPLWIRTRFFRCAASANDLSQNTHVCGFSPLWIRK